MPVHPDATGQPFFVVGSGRCGSTLLRVMLASHSRLAIPPETWFLIPLVRRFPLDRPLDGEELAAAAEIMIADYRWTDLNFPADEFRRQARALVAPTLRDVVEVVYRRHMAAEGKPRWGDKTPVYIAIVPQLARMYPQARFIHLIRDGRDVAKSFQHTGWVGPWLHDNTREWVEAQNCHWRWIRAEFRDRFLPVRYEDLVVDTEKTLRTVCAFIGESFEPQMLSWERKVDDQVPAREQIRHTKLKQRLGTAAVARWKHSMSAREVLVCEAFMGYHLRRLGYGLRFESPLWVPVFALTRLYCLAVLPCVRFGIRAFRYVHRRWRARTTTA